MRLFPVLIDARPAYLGGGHAPRSLLLTPVGPRTLLEHVHVGFRTISPHPVTVLTVFEPDEAYTRALRASRVAIEAVLPIRAFAERVHAHQPSDWFLIRDARRVSASPLDIEDIVGDLGNDPRWVRHVVPLAATVAGTSEYVILDPGGRVSRIQRSSWSKCTWVCSTSVRQAGITASSAERSTTPSRSTNSRWVSSICGSSSCSASDHSRVGAFMRAG